MNTNSSSFLVYFLLGILALFFLFSFGSWSGASYPGYGMMSMMGGGMFFGIGFLWILVIVFLILGIIWLLQQLQPTKRRK